MNFTELTNTNREVRGIIYDICATYNIILLDNRKSAALYMIRKEYSDLDLPDIVDTNFKSKLTSIFDKKLNVSLTLVIKACEHDEIFLDFVNFLENLAH
ncbi:hypothetical protein ACFVRR_13550 [Gottfriedia sp. NPDC057948]|uniref:hypothetical protein n=1 Tax=Gottfriedia sp. NPDC057948 TaxID=3346287 RepID=UPI0006FA858D|nr:hypothetical protein AN960_16175 [Bacillus sp. FJAT-25509]